jgi:hypothetical protein
MDSITVFFVIAERGDSDLGPVNADGHREKAPRCHGQLFEVPETLGGSQGTGIAKNAAPSQ